MPGATVTVPSGAMVRAGPPLVWVRVTVPGVAGTPSTKSLVSTLPALVPAGAGPSASVTASMVETVTVAVAVSQLSGTAASQIW